MSTRYTSTLTIWHPSGQVIVRDLEHIETIGVASYLATGVVKILNAGRRASIKTTTGTLYLPADHGCVFEISEVKEVSDAG